MKGYNYIKSGVRPRAKKTTDDCIQHLIKRMSQRYRIYLTVEDVKALSKFISENTPEIARFVFKQTNTRSFYEIQIRGVWYPVVYNKVLRQLVTALPYNWRETAQDHGYVVQ